MNTCQNPDCNKVIPPKRKYCSKSCAGKRPCSEEKKSKIKKSIQSEEIQNKIKQTCIDRYGVNNPLQSEEIKNQIKQTCLDRYGVEHPLQSEEIKDTVKQTFIERYGVNNPFQSEEIKNQIKQTMIEKYGGFTLQSNDLKEKVKQTINNRYGVEYPLQSEEIKEKFKQTCLEKYRGVAPACSQEVQEKMKDTCLEKYGVNYSFQSEETKEKIKQTMIERYGVEYPSQSEETKEKIKQTCIDRYGVNNPLQSEEIKNQIKQIITKKYGVEHPLQSEEIKEKFKQTCIDRYGVNNPLQSEEIKDKVKQTCLDRYGSSFYTQKHIPKEFLSQEWWENRKDFFEAKKITKQQISKRTCYLYAHKFRPDWKFQYFISQPHQRVINLLNEYQIEFEVNNRQVIKPLELDIYIPSKSLAIEVNGIYWHSEIAGGKDRNYHLNKTIACEKKGIRLLQFWDIEIEDKWDIIKSIILSKIGIYKLKIGARKCKVIQVPNIVEKYFLNENHFQGYRPSSICLGLEYKSELVSLMSFTRPRFSSRYNWELLRFCNKKDTQVIGGASKLFNKRPEGSLITYADRRYSQGNLYLQLGMNQQDSSNPSYSYTKDYQVLENRMKYQKHKLPNILETFNPDLTEWENMKVNGFDRIWDCGNLVFKM